MGNTQRLFATAFCLIMYLSGTLLAQDYEFKVLANKGSNQFSTNGTDWAPIKTGGTLKSGDQVKLGDQSYLGLMHKSGQTYEIKTAGIHKMSDITTALSSNKSSVASKYADFVLSKANQSDEDINKNHRQYMAATGAVTRGENDKIKLLLPSTGDVFNDENTLKWTVVDDLKDPVYVVSVSNMFDEQIYSTETNDSILSINLSDPAFKDERLIIVDVSLKDDPEFKSGKYAIKRLDPEFDQTVVMELDELKEMTKEETAMNMLILASFYEQNNLLVDALSYYQAAMDLAPDVDIFRHAYEQFVVSNSLGTK